MLISHDKKFIFIHIYKTGGTSVMHALQPFARQVPRPMKLLLAVVNRYQIKLPAAIRRVLPYPMHSNAQFLRDALTPEVFDDYFTFAFVRNPWDLQVSLYHYAVKEPWNYHHKEIVALGSFDAYVEWRLKQGQRQQNSFVVDEDGKRIVDFVGKMENIDADFQEICKRIGVEAQLPHINKSAHKPYQDYYTDATRDAIGELCREDIETFGYTF